MGRSSIFSTIILLSALWGGTAWGLEDGPKKGVLTRDCKVWNRPPDTSLEPNPKVPKRVTLGSMIKGEKLSTKGAERQGFVPIDYKGRIAYILRSCLETTDQRKPDSLLFSGFSGEEFRFGLNTSADANMARGSATADASTSFGYGLGLVAMLPIKKKFRISFSPFYRTITATRTLSSAASVLTDPSSASYQQNLAFLGLEALAQFNLVRPSGAQTQIEWWLDGGFEYLIPLSATQTDSNGRTIAFKSSDKPLLAVIGPSLLYHFDGAFALNVSLHGYYNVFAAGGNSLLGGRLGISGTLAL